MKIVVRKREFLESLQRVKATVSASKMVQLLQCYCFKDNKVMTWNGQSGTVTDCPLEGVDFAILAERFHKLVNGLFDEIQFEFKKDELHIKSGSYKGKLGTVSTRGFPDILPPEQEMYCESPDLTSRLEHVAFSVGTDSTKPAFLGIAIRNSYVYAGDGKRLSRATLTTPAKGLVTIPGPAVEHIVKLGQPDHLFKSQGKVGAFYARGNTTYITSLLAAEFPCNAVDSQFSTLPKIEYLVTFPAELPYALQRVTVLAGEEVEVVVENTQEGLVVSIQTAEVGEAKEVIPWDCKTPFKFCVDPNFLRQSFEKTEKVDITNIVEGDCRKLAFTGDNFNHILALRLLKG